MGEKRLEGEVGEKACPCLCSLLMSSLASHTSAAECVAACGSHGIHHGVCSLPSGLRSQMATGGELHGKHLTVEACVSYLVLLLLSEWRASSGLSQEVKGCPFCQVCRDSCLVCCFSAERYQGSAAPWLNAVSVLFGCAVYLKI